MTKADIDYRETCGCGEPTHYASLVVETAVRRIIDERGPVVLMHVEGMERGVWVPRHYIALHGVLGADIDRLADEYGWLREHE